MGGLYIGLAITMGILAIGPLTGGALNPARWFGPAVLGDAAGKTDMSLGWLSFVYVLGPVTGGLVAAWVYQFVMMGRDQLPSKT
jgi:glycerol uptake facilitator-like aquaporin